MKIYDKEMYHKQEEIRNVIIIIVAFLVGFFVGYIANSFSQDNINNNIVQENSIVNEMKINQNKSVNE